MKIKPGLMAIVFALMYFSSPSYAGHGMGNLDLSGNGWWLLFGGGIAYRQPVGENHGPADPYGGPELSLVRYQVPYFWGVYCDIRFDGPGVEGTDYTISVGGEFGYANIDSFLYFGFDAGLLHAWREENRYNGLSGRFFLPFPFVIPYVRYEFLYRHEDYWEVGVLLKIPIYHHRPPHSR